MMVREGGKEEVVQGASGEMRALRSVRRCEGGDIGPVGERQKRGGGEKGRGGDRR